MLSLPLLLKAPWEDEAMEREQEQWREDEEERDYEEAAIARPNTSDTITV